MRPIFLGAFFLGTILIGWLLFTYFSESGREVSFPSVDAEEDYGADFLTYTHDLGFSFRYAPYMKVVEDPDGKRLYIISRDENGKSTVAPIILSLGVNDEGMSPEEWLLSPAAGLAEGSEYYKTTIDDQEAVYTEGGMWVVVNTPNNEYRLSIADLLMDDEPRPYTQMGIIVESLEFK